MQVGSRRKSILTCYWCAPFCYPRVFFDHISVLTVCSQRGRLLRRRFKKHNGTGIIIYKQHRLQCLSELLILGLVHDVSVLTTGIAAIAPHIGVSAHLSLQGHDSEGQEASHGSKSQTHKHG